MKRLKGGPDQCAERSGRCRCTQRQAEAWADEADGDREEMEIADEPEGPLIGYATMAFILRHKINRADLDLTECVAGNVVHLLENRLPPLAAALDACGDLLEMVVGLSQDLRLVDRQEHAIFHDESPVHDGAVNAAPLG